MADGSTIEWLNRPGTKPASWNPVRGCSRVSPGCGGPRHEGGCYAEKIAARFSDPGQPFHGFAERTPHGGRWTGKLALLPDKLTEPLKWRSPRTIFVNSMSDLFHENLRDEDIDQVFAVMALTPQHTHIVLTKRAERMREYFTKRKFRDTHPLEARADEINLQMDKLTGPSIHYEDLPLPNVWLGVSAERQQEADERLPHLINTPAVVRFVSYEPALGPLLLQHDDLRDGVVRNWLGRGGIQWVIDGGESGPGARDYNIGWSRDVEAQCVKAGVAYFRKQLGAKPYDWREPSAWPAGFPHGDGSVKLIGDGFGRYYITGLKSKKGGDPAEWPIDLRRREFPATRTIGAAA